MRISDWSSDVCSSDLVPPKLAQRPYYQGQQKHQTGDRRDQIGRRIHANGEEQADDPQHSACRKKIARDGEPVLRSRYTPFGSIIGGPADVASSGPESDSDRGSDSCKEINELLVHMSAPTRTGTTAEAMEIENHK